MTHLYIFNSAVRGAEYGIGTYIRQLLSALKSSGLKVTMVKTIYSDKEFTVEEKKGVRYITIPAPVVGTVTDELDAFDKTIPFILFPYIDNSEQNIFHINYVGARSLIEAMKQYYPGKVILTVHYTDWSFSLLGNRRKLKEVLKKKEADCDKRETALRKSLNKEKEALKLCDHILAISQHSYNDLIKIHEVPRSKLQLVNNALADKYKALPEDKKAHLKQRYKIADNDINIIYAGRLDEVKGVSILIHSFKQVLDEHPNARLIMAGEGSFPTLLAKASPIWTRITFTGFLSAKELSNLYSIADIGVVPSLHEEFGFVAVEMMMHNIPMVVSDTTGLAEIVDNEVNGLKAKIKQGKRSEKASVSSLAEKIIQLIELPALRQELGRNARRKFKSHYELSIFQNRMMKVYNSCILTDLKANAVK